MQCFCYYWLIFGPSQHCLILYCSQVKRGKEGINTFFYTYRTYFPPDLYPCPSSNPTLSLKANGRRERRRKTKRMKMSVKTR